MAQFEVFGAEDETWGTYEARDEASAVRAVDRLLDLQHGAGGESLRATHGIRLTAKPCARPAPASADDLLREMDLLHAPAMGARLAWKRLPDGPEKEAAAVRFSLLVTLRECLGRRWDEAYEAAARRQRDRKIRV